MARNGKIARLPSRIREELNLRLEQGERGPELLEWVNGHQSVADLMMDEFDGFPISKQNLSEWRKDGFREWQRNRQLRYWLEANSNISSDEQRGKMLDLEVMHEQLARVASTELALMLYGLSFGVVDPSDDKACEGAAKDLLDERRWKALQGVLRELSRLRRDDQRAVRTKLACRKWHNQDARADLDLVMKDLRKDEKRLEERIKEDQRAEKLSSAARRETPAERDYRSYGVQNKHPYESPKPKKALNKSKSREGVRQKSAVPTKNPKPQAQPQDGNPNAGEQGAAQQPDHGLADKAVRAPAPVGIAVGAIFSASQSQSHLVKPLFSDTAPEGSETENRRDGESAIEVHVAPS